MQQVDDAHKHGNFYMVATEIYSAARQGTEKMLQVAPLISLLFGVLIWDDPSNPKWVKERMPLPLLATAVLNVDEGG